MPCCSVAPLPPASPPVTESEEIYLGLEGLHCINCVGKVENILRSRPGVKSAHVNLTKKQARVSVEAPVFELTTALDELAKAGFNGRLISNKQSSQHEQEAVEQRAILLKMGVAASVTANVMMLSVAMYA